MSAALDLRPSAQCYDLPRLTSGRVTQHHLRLFFTSVDNSNAVHFGPKRELGPVLLKTTARTRPNFPANHTDTDEVAMIQTSHLLLQYPLQVLAVWF